MQRKIKKRVFTGSTSCKITKREENHRMVARRAAQEGIVLLKNTGDILPLAEGTSIALYGIGASKTIKGGTGSGDVNEREKISIYQGLKEAGFCITNEDWITDFDRRYDQARLEWRDSILSKTRGKQDCAKDFFGVYTSNPFIIPSGKKAEKTEAEVAIYVLSRIAGEGADRLAKEGDYYLTEEEKKMLSDISRYYREVIVVLNAGGAVDLSFMDEFANISGLIQIAQPGMEGGHAFADIVSGKVTPSGKLTDSWAYRYEDYPNLTNEIYEEGIYVGYRYFDCFEKEVRYGFGYGLSYTEFSMEMKEISLIYGENGVQISLAVQVTNVGRTKGKEVVQGYVSCPTKNLEKEYRRLAGFVKTKELMQGESELVEISIPVEQLTSYDERIPGWILEEGNYGIWIGNSLENSKILALMQLDESVTLVKTENICPRSEEIKEIHANKDKQMARYEEWNRIAKEQNVSVLYLEASKLKTRTIEYAKNSKLVQSESYEFTEELSLEQLIGMATGDPGKAQGGNLGAAGISVPGSAGETNSCARDKNLASIVLADGPAGLRLMQYYYVEDDKIVSMPFQFSLEGGLFCPEAEQMSGTRYYQYCTAIPTGTLLAQTWNLQLLGEVGMMMGKEMELFGVTLWLAPGMNIHRNPLCGRNFEYYSEDPFLSGRLAAAITKGVQKNQGCGTTIKHFACNNQENNRKSSNSVLSERALREIYLKGFEIAITEAQPLSLMTSYNLINGTHAANSKDLCTKVARDEWGFAGFIMTDWTTTQEDDSCTAAGCIRAGNDLIMPGCFADHTNLKQEIEEGTLEIEDLKACVSRIVDIIWKSNQYERIGD